MARNELTEAEFTQRGFGRTLGFGKRPVLGVIDMTYGFTDSSNALGSNLDAEIEQINRLLDAAHQSSVPVIFTVVSYDDDGLRDAGVWARKIGGSHDMRTGSRNVDIDSRLHRDKKDAVIVKKYASGFFGTDLVSRLLSFDADTFVITGCSTSGCVRATAVDSCQVGFIPIVVEDAVGDRSRSAHDQSIFDLQSRYADIVKTDEAVAYFDRYRLVSS